MIGTPIAGYVYVKAPVRRELIGSRFTEPTDPGPGGAELRADESHELRPVSG